MTKNRELASSLADKFLQNELSGDFADREAADPGKMGPSTVTPEAFADLLVLLLGWQAFHDVAGEDDPHLQQGTALIRRYQPQIKEGIETHLLPLVEEPGFQAFRSDLQRATRGGSGSAMATVQAAAMFTMLPVLRSKTQVMNEVFPERARPTARKVAQAASEETGEAVLATLVQAPSASRMRMPRQWIKKAARMAGVGPSEIEEAVTDASEARDLGEALRSVEARLAALDPTSPDAVALQEEKQELLGGIEEIAEGSSLPDTVKAVAVAAASAPREYATETGRARKLNPDKEAAMMIRGKGLIAAGAGAGKTMTLASKVVYHVNELGVPVRSVMATSFSRKSAAELRKRIEKYGAPIAKQDSGGFGTTHKIASGLFRSYQRGADRDYVKDYEQNNLVRLAVEQIQMGSPGQYGEPPEPVGMFDVALLSSEPEKPESPPMTFKEACELAYERRGKMKNPFLRSFIESFFNPRDKWYNLTMRRTQNLLDPTALSAKQKEILMDIFKFTQVDYHKSRDPNYGAGGFQQRRAKKDRDKGLREKYEFFSRPAGQWFNLGLKIREEDEPLPLGDFKRAIEQYKGRCISPSEAWAMAQGEEGYGSPAEAAAYAAYEWLKGPTGEGEFQGKGDFNDVILDLCKLMVSNPTARGQIQSRFKVVLVDEAQDLNRSQHVMFGLISGYLDHEKLANVAQAEKMGELAKDDGSMTADTYVFIGDDKQAIYEFRSADPEAFIDMSDLVEGGAGFTTHVLETNYRSGREIVEAANRLIAHNQKQIPMECRPNPERQDEGAVAIKQFPPDAEAMAAEWVAEKILSEMTEGVGDNTEAPSYDSFGLALRSRKEQYTYGMELLKRGIPFRSKANFFRDKNSKALLSWLTIADEGLEGNTDRVNKAVLAARLAPATKLGKKFDEMLQEKAAGNYVEWLRDNWEQVYGPGNRWGQYVKMFTDNLLKAAEMDTSDMEPEEVLAEILQFTGFDGTSVRDALVEQVWSDKEQIEELRAEAADGKIDEDMVKDIAMAPLEPLTGLLNSRPNLTEAMRFSRQLADANEKITAEDDPNAEGFAEPAVTLGTMHSWKGLEVPHIFIPMLGGQFPRWDKSGEELESERRLAYVAITRGEDRVTVLNVPKTRKVGKTVVVETSPFISEMCVPPTAPLKPEEAPVPKTAQEEEVEEFVDVPADISPQDEEMMDAYLRGEDPFANFGLRRVASIEEAWGDTLFDKE